MIARKSVAVTFATSILALFGAPAANAGLVTIGSPLKGEFTWPTLAPESTTFVNTQLPGGGAKLVSPVEGAVIRWRLSEGFSGGSFQLQVVKPGDPGEYFGGPLSGVVNPSGAPQTLATDLPIKKGEGIGLLGGGPQAVLGSRLEPGSRGAEFKTFSPPLAAGGGATLGTPGPAGVELGFNADILAAPTVAGISPATGRAAGGTKVTITGTSFAKVTKVSFGSNAASYNVESEGKITATAPAGTPSSSVRVSVTTVAGSATAPVKFTYKPKTATTKPKGKKSSRAPRVAVGP